MGKDGHDIDALVAQLCQEHFQAFQQWIVDHQDDDDDGNEGDKTLTFDGDLDDPVSVQFVVKECQRRAKRLLKDALLNDLNRNVARWNMQEPNNERASRSDDDEKKNDKAAVPLRLSAHLLEQFLPACLAMAHASSQSSTTGSAPNTIAMVKSCLLWIVTVTRECHGWTTSNNNSHDSTLHAEWHEFLENASTVQSDTVRAMVCFVTGYLWRHPFANSFLVLASSILIPRLTDKAISVRNAAIQAAGQVLSGDTSAATALAGDEEEEGIGDYDADSLLESLLWNVWHDPSVPNRVLAVQSLPVDAASWSKVGNHLLTRLRDVKERVRLATIQKLYEISSLSTLEASQWAEIISSTGIGMGGIDPGNGEASSLANTPRCQATRDATVQFLCCHVLKLAKFNVLNLLEVMDVAQYEDEATRVIQVVWQVLQSNNMNNTAPDSSSSNSTNTDTAISSAMLARTLSPPELRALATCIHNHVITLEDCLQTSEDGDDDSTNSRKTSPAQCLLARVLATLAPDSYLSKIVPDMGVVCDVFQHYSLRLLEATTISNSCGGSEDEQQDQALFICLQLLQLATLVGKEEEGSRRRFTTLLQALLITTTTTTAASLSPQRGVFEDLMDGAIKALLQLHGVTSTTASARSLVSMDETSVVTVLQTVMDQVISTGGDNEDGKGNHVLESSPHQLLCVLTMLSIVLEEVSPTHKEISQFLQNMAAPLVQRVLSEKTATSTHDDELVSTAASTVRLLLREAAVSCLGKLGLWSSATTLLESYKPLLLRLAANPNEAWTIRSQATMALSDWALLYEQVLQPIVLNFDDSENNCSSAVSLSQVLQELLTCANSSVIAIAAEATAKLLFANRLWDCTLVAHLLVLFVYPSCTSCLVDTEEDGDPTQVGSTTRMQQWLSLFFPAYSLQSVEAREAILESLRIALQLALSSWYSNTTGGGKSKSAKSKKKKAILSLVDLVEFVCSVVTVAQDEMEHQQKEGMDLDKNDGSNAPPFSSAAIVGLRIADQVSRFLLEVLTLEEEESGRGSTKQTKSLTATQLRGLCKLAGSLDIMAVVHIAGVEEDDNSPRLGVISSSTQSIVTQLHATLEDLGMMLTDGTALKALTPLAQDVSTLMTCKVLDNMAEHVDGNLRKESDVSGAVSKTTIQNVSHRESSASTITEAFSASADTTISEDSVLHQQQHHEQSLCLVNDKENEHGLAVRTGKQSAESAPAQANNPHGNVATASHGRAARTRGGGGGALQETSN